MLKSNLSELHAEDNIAVLTIDNGPKNLLSEPEFIDRKELLGWLDENPQVGALIITGKGRHFSHGADVSLFGEAGGTDLSAKLENARELLPAELLSRIQKYCEGCLIYIPKRGKKAAWGKSNGARGRYDERNRQICKMHVSGTPVKELSQMYWLSEDSIRKIIRRRKPKSPK